MLGGRPVREFPRVDVESHVRAVAAVEGNPFERPQRSACEFDAVGVARRRADVHLRHLCPVAAASVADAEGYVQATVVGRFDLQLRVAELRVREAVPEREERRDLVFVEPLVALEDAVRRHVHGPVGVRSLDRIAQEVTRVERAVAVVGARARVVVRDHDRGRIAAGVVGREPRPRSRSVRERDRELAARVDFAGQDVGGGDATRHARIPHLEHRLDVAEPRHVDGVAGVEDDDDVRVDRGDSRDQRVLPARELQAEVLVVAAAVDAFGAVVEREDHDLLRGARGRGGRGDRLCLPVRRNPFEADRERIGRVGVGTKVELVRLACREGRREGGLLELEAVVRLARLRQAVPGGDRRAADAAGCNAVGADVDPALSRREPVDEELGAALVLHEHLQLPGVRTGRCRGHGEVRRPAPGRPRRERARVARVVDSRVDRSAAQVPAHAAGSEPEAGSVVEICRRSQPFCAGRNRRCGRGHELTVRSYPWT